MFEMRYAMLLITMVVIVTRLIRLIVKMRLTKFRTLAQKIRLTKFRTWMVFQNVLFCEIFANGPPWSIFIDNKLFIVRTTAKTGKPQPLQIYMSTMPTSFIKVCFLLFCSNLTSCFTFCFIGFEKARTSRLLLQRLLNYDE